MSDTFIPPSLETLNELLPAYEFLGFIAQGGMGAVYHARQISLDREVAIKILPLELSADPEFCASFQTEAKAMAKLNHPNLISIYDFGDVQGMLYIAMEYVPGKSLYHSAWNQKIEQQEAARIVKAICDGLAHAHENGIIHRDIKPANILLTPKIEPKIGDFGLATPAGGATGGIAYGTPGYTAPEAISNPEKLDRRSDIFAVGVILHELLTGGARPDTNSPTASALSGCHPIFDKIITKATHASAAMRYPTASAMSDAITEALVQIKSPVLSPPMHAGRALQRPNVPVRHVASSGGGSSAFIKLITICGLIALSAIAWQVLKDKKKDYEKKEAAQQNKEAEITEQKPISSFNPLPKIDESERNALTEQTLKKEGAIPRTATPQSEAEKAAAAASANPNTSVTESTETMVDKTPEDEGFKLPEAVALPTTSHPEANALTAKARELVKTANTKKITAQKEAATHLAWELESWLRGLGGRDKQMWTTANGKLCELARNNSIPTAEALDELYVPEVENNAKDPNDTYYYREYQRAKKEQSKVAKLKQSPTPEFVTKAHAKVLEKQQAAEKAYLSTITTIRDAYIKNLTPFASKAAQEGNKQILDELRALAAAAKDLDNWTRSLTK